MKAHEGSPVRSGWLGAGALREALGLLGMLVVGGVVLLVLQGLVSGESAALTQERLTAAAGKEERPVPVIVQVVEPTTILDQLSLPGQIQAFERVRLSTQVKGLVAARHVAEGAAVKKGQLLLSLDDRDYRTDLDGAEAQFRLAEQNLASTQALVKRQVESKSSLDRDTAAYQLGKAALERARTDLERCQIRSPLDGVLDDVVPEVGEFVPAEREVAVVLQTGRVKVEVGIPEQDVHAVRSVTSCTMVVDSVGDGLAVTGTVTFLSMQPAAYALVYTLRLEADNAAGLMRPGMFVNAKIVKARHENALQVPLFAVVARRDSYAAFVVEDAVGGALVARERPVKLGLLQGRTVEVTAGLRPGERLVVVGQRALADGARLRVMRTVRSMDELLR